MKRVMTYPELKIIGKNIAACIRETIKNPKLFAIMRGGMTLGHIIGYELGLPVGAYTPKNQGFLHPELNAVLREFPCVKATYTPTWVFLEDVLATGRTVRELTRCLSQRVHLGSQDVDWVLFPSVVDKYAPELPHVCSSASLVTSDWIVFPYEDEDKVMEFDRGLFRNGTSQNAKDAK